MVLGNKEMMSMIKNVKYRPRGLLDHSPLTVSLELGERNHPGKWRISPFLIELMGEPNKVLLEPLGEFLDLNTGIVWDTLKAFLRGILIQQISKIKKQTTENKYLFQKQSAFGEGESVECMLAQLVRVNSPSSVVPMITIGEGRVSSYTPEIARLPLGRRKGGRNGQLFQGFESPLSY